MASLFDAVFHRRILKRWGRVSRDAEKYDLEDLRSLRTQARQIRRRLDRVIYVAEGRLALPAVGSNAIMKPLHTDWTYRPELWRGPISPLGMSSVESKTEYGAEVKLFHDCRFNELTLRQVRNNRESDLAPFGLRMDVFRFDGSFLSLVIELPESAVKGLTRRHLVRLNTVVDVERPVEIFARLNVKHGPNVEQIVRELPLGEDDVTVEFDLAYTKMNERRVERMWLDLIFEGAEMNQVTLRDVSLSRRPRAEI